MDGRRDRPVRFAHAVVGALLPLVVACDLAYPEVVVVNETATTVLLRDLSFSGCRWSTVLGLGEATSTQRCLAGDDRVHFQKLDLTSFDPQGESGAPPTWFRYQTVTTWRVAYGDFQRLEIRLDDLEQDFSVPGPYGH